MEQGISELKASRLLEFILKGMVPIVHNHAVSDARPRMAEMIGEIAGTCYTPEFGCWKDSSSNNNAQCKRSHEG